MEHAISIELKETGKKFNREWIFQSLSHQFKSGSKTVILGSNGSGKSTLLQVIASYLIPDKGSVSYYTDKELIKQDDIRRFISIASPYLQLTEEFTLNDIIDHYRVFKPLLINESNKSIAAHFQLEQVLHKQIRHYSSGMKQRVKLGLAIASESPVLFLDEPLSNLDTNGLNWYQNMLSEFTLHKTLIVCSNAIKEEYALCDNTINLSDYKRI